MPSHSTATANDPATKEKQWDTISSTSFVSLLTTQWLTAINDNAFRWLVVGIGKEYVEPGEEGSILAMGLGFFVLPYLLVAAPAGYLADRYSKRSVIIACKFAEIVIMALGVLAIVMGYMWLMFLMVALMGAQSALFSPAKMGTIPELLPSHRIPLANGLFGLSTVTATILGMGMGLWLSEFTKPKGQENLWMTIAVVIGLAAIGTTISFGIRHIPAANPRLKFPWNPIARTVHDLANLAQKRDLFLVAIGIVFYWSLGAVAQVNIDQYATESGAFAQTERFPLLLSLVIGVGAGSVLAGVWSRGRIELGMVFIAGLGIAVFSAFTFAIDEHIFNQPERINGPLILSMIGLLALGVSSGMFNVPLTAYIQHRSPPETRGAIISATNFLVFSGILVAALLFGALRLPYQQGELVRIPDELINRNLDDADLRTVELQVNKFETDWSNYRDEIQSQRLGNPVTFDEQTELVEPKLEEFLTGATEKTRSLLLARLLWVELDQRKQLGERIHKDDYYRRCLTGEVLVPEDRMLVKAVCEQSSRLPLVTSRQIFLLMGICTLPICFFILWKLPQETLRFMIWWGCWCWFGFRVQGIGHIPDRTPALFVANRGSWFHRLLLMLVIPRRVRMVTWQPAAERGWRKHWDRFWQVIRIQGGPTRVQKGKEESRRALRNGKFLAAVPESIPGGSNRGYSSELLEMLDGLKVPIVPVSFLSQSVFDRQQPKTFWGVAQAWIRGFRSGFLIRFETPEDKPATIQEVHRMVSKMGNPTTNESNAEWTSELISVPQKFIRAAKANKSKWRVGDLLGGNLHNNELLLRTLILRRLLLRHVLQPTDKYVGLLLPPSAPGAVANLALTLDRRVAVNLNYTSSEETINSCIEQCGIRVILTTERVVEKLGFKPNAELILLETMKDKVKLFDKLSAVAGTYLKSARGLERSLGLDHIQPNDLLTVIFTSGSTGTPKGVMLTHHNVASNIHAFNQVLSFRDDDVMIGILPFFHSFGFTVSLWGALSLDIGVAYHFNPLDAKQIGKLCKRFKGTCLLSTPTFLRSYTRRCTESQFKTLDVVVAGAEKLSEDVAKAFEEKFHVLPVEGYGATELSPVCCVNVPPGRANQVTGIERKPGTVGRPLPGVEAKATDLETGEDLGIGETGMLWMRGPNVMSGYLNREELTQEVVVDGWYKTGDVGLIDEDGFVTITGRLSRFSKIGGEMIPHIPIEDQLNRILGADDEGLLKAAVTSVPDGKKGERLIVLHTATDLSSSELLKELKEAGLPNLYLPATDAFIEVDEIPVLGTGKLDLKALKDRASEVFGNAS